MTPAFFGCFVYSFQGLNFLEKSHFQHLQSIPVRTAKEAISKAQYAFSRSPIQSCMYSKHVNNKYFCVLKHRFGDTSPSFLAFTVSSGRNNLTRKQLQEQWTNLKARDFYSRVLKYTVQLIIISRNKASHMTGMLQADYFLQWKMEKAKLTMKNAVLLRQQTYIFPSHPTFLATN